MNPCLRQRGGSTLAVVLILVVVLLLGVAFAHRGLLFEQKASANQYRAAQAFEAAEAGLEWAVALLNNDVALGDDCLPDPGAAALSFRDRHLGHDGLQAACVQQGSEWTCHCPAGGPPRLSAPPDLPPRAFAVRFTASERSGLTQLVSRGCSGGLSPCLPDSDPADARAQTQVTLARMPGLATLPAAALTVRGAVQLPAAGFNVQHTDPASGGLTVHSGGPVTAPHLSLQSAPGTPGHSSLAERDPALAALSADGLFASVFHMGKAHWAAQPGVRRVACASACDLALARAAEAGTAPALIWLDQGLHLESLRALGTPDKPVALVVDGPVRLGAALQIHGFVYVSGSRWEDAAGASVHGAVVVEGELQGSGATRIRHDAAVLARLRDRSGTFARVPGSWRDF